MCVNYYYEEYQDTRNNLFNNFPHDDSIACEICHKCCENRYFNLTSNNLQDDELNEQAFGRDERSAKTNIWGVTQNRQENAYSGGYVKNERVGRLKEENFGEIAEGLTADLKNQTAYYNHWEN